MRALVAHRFLPSLVASSCRRHFSSTRPVFVQQKRLPNVQNVGRANITPSQSKKRNADPVPVLDELLYPGTRDRLMKYIPLQAAADIVTKLRSVPEGHATPPEMVAEVLKLAERADRSHKPWPTKAISVLAMSLARPGESPGSEKNGDLIAKLLLIVTRGASNSPSGQRHFMNGTLYGVLKNRVNGEGILLTDYSSEARKECARLLATYSLFPSVYGSRTAHNLRRESDPGKRDMLVQMYLDHMNDMYSRASDSYRITICLEFGRTYAFGYTLPRDGQKAKLWWERAVILGSGLPSPNAEPVARAAYLLARIYLGRQPASYGDVPFFPPDVPKAIRYLHLAKWAYCDAAYLLGQIHYLDYKSRHLAKAIKRHVTKFGVVPDDALAAEGFYIGAERFGHVPSQARFAEMVKLRRAHPPVDPLIAKAEIIVPQASASPPRTTELTDAPSEDDLERALSSYNNVPRIELTKAS